MLDYLIKNFGADSKPRAVRPDKEMLLDEAKLGKAQYIEYYLTPDSSNPTTAAGQPQGELAQSSNRILYTMQLDNDGNAWGVDRGNPNRLVKLDPRTGAQKDYVLPDPRAGVHELVIDREGIIWVPELGARLPRGSTGCLDSIRRPSSGNIRSMPIQTMSSAIPTRSACTRRSSTRRAIST